MNFEDRQFQAVAHEQTLVRIAEGHRPIVCSPTGSGKTVMEARLARHYMEQGKRVLALSFREEILNQMFATYNAFCGVGNVGYLMRDKGPFWMYPPVTVASADTLKSRWNKSDVWHIPADVLLIDEAHLSLSEMMAETIMPHYREKIVIGFTATPARKTGRGLGSYFTRIIQTATVQQLIDLGYLAPCEYWAGSHVDTAKINVDRKTNDFKENELATAAMEGKLIGDVIDNWLRLARGRHTIVFGVDIAHAQALTERFQAAGITAEIIHSKMTHGTRDKLTQQFRDRQYEVLVNVGIATYGFDVPSINCVVLAKPTKSIVLHHQMIGRGIRPKPDGDFCLVLDHADNVRRLGCIEDKIRWRLAEGEEAATNVTREGDPTRKMPAEDAPTPCGQCGHMFSRSRVCPKCGWEKPVRAANIEEVPADLVKVRKSQRDLELEASNGGAEWFQMMRGWCLDHGKKNGFAAHSFRERFKTDIKPEWWRLPVLRPDQRVQAYMQSKLIRFAKRRGRSHGARAEARP